MVCSGILRSGNALPQRKTTRDPNSEIEIGFAVNMFIRTPMNHRLTELRSLLATRFPGSVDTHFSAASPRQNSTSLLPGKLVEIASPSGCGGEGLLLRRFCEESTGAMALVDAANAFDPSILTQQTRQRLLWVRCHRAAEAVRTADLLLRDGNLTTVLMDLRLLPPRELLRLPSSVWHRLRMLAERAQASVGIFSPCRVVPCAAQRWLLQDSLELHALEEPVETLAARLHPQAAERLFHEAADLAIAS